MITILLISVCVIFIFEFLFFIYGLRKATDLKRNYKYEPFVSVVVAARNEEANIRKCLESLSRLEYIPDKLQIIVVNDQSTDATESLIKEVTLNDIRFKLVNAVNGEGKLKGKANALAQGIGISNGEIILFTDADCVVQPKWVRETVSYFTDDVGIVAGFTILEAKSIFAGFQSLDWIFLYSVASATATLGFPLTAVGNNLAVRRTAYNSVGGYPGIPFSVTEDYMLTRRIIEQTGLKMAFPLNENTSIISKACETWKQLFHQRKRWGVGALDMVTIGFVVFGVPYALLLLLLLGLFFIPSFHVLICLAIKFLLEIILILFSLKQLKSGSYIKYYLFFEMYYFIYVLVLPWISIFSKKVLWKDRSL
jgi:cellulose synthase/poly-beta-1,6-N-acetylglucosamine synthase-like glycosyltransferase